MISLKVGSLTGLSSKLGLKRSKTASAEPVATVPGATKAPKRPPRRRAPKPGSSFRPKLVLASASPRRLQLLEQAGIAPDALRPSSVDESVSKGEVPRQIVRRLAKAKAEAALKIVKGEPDLAKSFLIAADTVVAVGRRVRADAGGEAVVGGQGAQGREGRQQLEVAGGVEALGGDAVVQDLAALQLRHAQAHVHGLQEGVVQQRVDARVQPARRGRRRQPPPGRVGDQRRREQHGEHAAGEDGAGAEAGAGRHGTDPIALR